MTKRNVIITIATARIEAPEELFEEGENASVPFDGFHAEFPEPTELWVEGKLITNANRVELIYEEGELSGMEGSVTSIGFERRSPQQVSMMRTGSVKTALFFEEGKRNFSVYETLFSDFQICVHTIQVKNELLTAGTLHLDYLIEIHGALAEHCRMTVTVRPQTTLGLNQASDI